MSIQTTTRARSTAFSAKRHRDPRPTGRRYVDDAAGSYVRRGPAQWLWRRLYWGSSKQGFDLKGHPMLPALSSPETKTVTEPAQEFVDQSARPSSRTWSPTEYRQARRRRLCSE